MIFSKVFTDVILINFYTIPAPPVGFFLNSSCFLEQASISSGVCLFFSLLHIGHISSPDDCLGGSDIMTNSYTNIIYNIFEVLF
jgi:hypothetical protein